jgi:hypothetical protein
MARVVTAPFRCAKNDRLQTDAWKLHEGDLASDLPRALPHWDFNTKLQLSRWVSVDLNAFRTDCGLSQGDRLRLVAAWRASGTALRGRATAVELPVDEQQWQGRLVFSLSGHDLGGVVRISTQVVLASEINPARLLTARLPGSILWKDEWSVAVEGRASRFPVEIIDFTSTSWAPEHAGWYLSWNSDDLHRPFLGNVRLYINEKHPKVATAVQAPEANAENQAIVSAIFFDVGRLLLTGVLESVEFLDDPEGFGEGSTGKAVWRMMRAVFPTESPTTLRNTLGERAAYFNAVLQQQLKLFGS